MLLGKAFSLTPTEYLSIHRKLFQGIYTHAGKMRDYNITKKEWVLDGATVLYGSATELSATLDYDISQEKKFSYKGLSINETISHLAFFVARLWQIHVFAEGNTRTTAVFLIKYLRALGFDAANDIFAENAWYFRNALVRANYNDLKAGIHETTEFLELFLRNLLLNETNLLHNRSMHISGMFDGFQKQYIGTQEQDIKIEKQDIDILKIYNSQLKTTSFSKKTLEHIQKLYDKFGNEKVFGRVDVIAMLGITASPASELIKKLLGIEIIVPVQGKGKGKYTFLMENN